MVIRLFLFLCETSISLSLSWSLFESFRRIFRSISIRIVVMITQTIIVECVSRHLKKIAFRLFSSWPSWWWWSSYSTLMSYHEHQHQHEWYDPWTDYFPHMACCIHTTRATFSTNVILMLMMTGLFSLDSKSESMEHKYTHRRLLEKNISIWLIHEGIVVWSSPLFFLINREGHAPLCVV